MGEDPPGTGLPPSLPEAGVGGGSTPWERREQIGLVNALVETTKQVIATPSEFFRRMSVRGGIGAPLAYGVIVGYFGILAKAIYDAVFQAVLGSSFASLGSRPEFQRFAALMQGGLGLLIQVLLGPVFAVIGIFVAAGVFHLLLMILGGAKRDFEATLRVVSYSEAASLFAIIPFCGAFVGGIYQIVLFIIGLAEAHGISKGLAAAAVLIPIALLCCCCAVAIAIFAGGLAAVLGQFR
jgi:hypothetical protein